MLFAEMGKYASEYNIQLDAYRPDVFSIRLFLHWHSVLL
jgi:hypothetical protein